ncbi:9457_t:CDS:10 [Funneliformis caledonium]|uniref:9457_t:CDS:1 n=1 Tax=Funneliformis caledonium TaxID=1117310 RepID=A0A9N9DR04_9GLOM|nr:9457_t:CDS:10 [Funneliformis caledonium]
MPDTPSKSPRPKSTKIIPEYRVISYVEAYDSHVHSAKSYYPNGPIIVRLANHINSTCDEPKLNIRLVYKDNKMQPINFDYAIPDFNFCKQGNDSKNLIEIYPLERRFFLVRYVQIVNESRQEMGLIVDWDGQIFRELTLSTDTSELGEAIINSNPQRGFIWINFIPNNILRWTNFSAPNDENLFTQETTKESELSGQNYKVFPTLDGGYGIVSAGQKPDATENVEEVPIVPLWEVTVKFIRPYTGEITKPSVIYSITTQVIDINIEVCDYAYDLPGLACIIRIQHTDGSISYVKIQFLSNGSTKNTVKIAFDGSLVDYIYPLHNGGYIFSVNSNKVEVNFTGNIYDSNGKWHVVWDCPKMYGQTITPHGVFPNNTVWMFFDGYYQSETSYPDTWTFMTATINELPQPSVNEYNNLNINATNPTIDGVFSTEIETETRSINITYSNTILLSTGNISIFQYEQDDEDNLILRQSYQTKSPKVTLSPDKRTITLNVLNHTFNMPNSKYTVVIDDDAVKDLSYEEPLMGISSNIWRFSTDNKQNIQEELKSQEHALVRLTSDASKNFDNLDFHQQSEFVQNLLHYLAKCVPVPQERMRTNSHSQWDPDVDSKQILLKFRILAVKDEQDISVNNIIQTLDEMIRDREISPISHYPYTALLDSTYGFRRKKNVWEKYDFKLLAFGATLLLLGILAIFSYKKYEDGNCFVAFKVLLIALDFGLDLAFVLAHSRDVLHLYIPSLLTFIIPLGLNTLITFFILIRELSNNTRFYKWFRTYHNVAAIFTVCSIADVDSLTMINSKLAGLDAFDAPISPGTEKWIFIVSIWNFIIEDTPQLIIQIIYIIYSVNYSIIPFLNLVSASLLWICIFFGRSYHMFLRYQDRHQVYQTTIRTPSSWLSQERHQDNSRHVNSGVNVGVDGGSNNNNGGRRNNDVSEYQPLERRSSVPLYNSSLGPFDDAMGIGVAGPSNNNRTRSGSGGISYELIGSEHGNTNTSASGNVNNGYERFYGNDKTLEMKYNV